MEERAASAVWFHTSDYKLTLTCGFLYNGFLRSPMQNMIGIYGDWAARIAPDPPRLSFRRSEWKRLDSWRKQERRRYRELLLQPDTGPTPEVVVERRFEYDGLSIEQ